MPDSAPQQCNATQEAPQRIIKIRRDYNTWVANETIEDYALRFTPRAFRKWSVFRVSNASFGAISFLVLEAIGGSIAVTYGFTNAFWAIIAVGIVIFLTGLPISYYAARHGVDMDLLTRGAGFGYIGSTISSFVYASFTFILFALEAAIMAYALRLALGMPLHIGYLVSALIVIPLVTHGVTLISRVQLATLPVWICLQVLPFAYIFAQRPDVLAQLPRFSGQSSSAGFTLAGFGAAMAVGVALVTQIGEQVDFLRFMPEETRHNRLRWHIGVLCAGPGWIVVGILKMLGGALLALLAIRSGVSWADAVNPTHMYLAGFRQVFGDPAFALAVTVFFIVVAQVKINLTNAYAGSLAWSNFFARLTHSHPGRVVWAVFNALIAVLLMELDVFTALEHVLGLYANVAIAWIAAVVADLVINKPLGLSPPGIEFRRAYLYDINPVGVGAMLLASLASICAYTGTLGTTAQALSPVVALATALTAAPLIAWLTKGRYYIARAPSPAHATPRQQTCVICERSYEAEDTAHCPAYQGPICSLCCCLDARCDDVCKPHARLSAQWEAAAKAMLPRAAWPYLTGGLAHFVLLMLVILAVLAALLALLYQHEAALPGDAASLARLHLAFIKLFGALTLVSAIAAWWLVLTSQSRRVAQEESNRQTSLLTREIELHGRTDAQLQQAKRAADQANQAKSRYVAGLSHEIRTPLNSILGYAQLLDNDPAIPAQRRQAIQVIRSSGEHLLSLIEGTLDMARIESGKFSFNMQTLPFAEFMAQLVRMFEQQAAERGLDFRFDVDGTLAVHVLADRKRLGQILINILGNAFKFTERGSVVLRLRYQRETALFEVEDTGPGIQPDELERIFEPFSRGSASDRAGTGGTGLGLPITKVLTQLMGGELRLDSVPGKGTTVRIRLRLPRVQAPPPNAAEHRDRIGFQGPPRRVLVVDNEAVDREMLRCALAPLGFVVEQAGSGPECLQRFGELAPDLILLDLAMPGIDGWEVARLIREVHRSQVPIAIVSANAFDKGQENPAAIPGEDFFVKPVNVNELLDWIGRKLELTWVTQAGAGAGTGPARGAAAIPPAEHLDALREQLKLGYVRGLQARLDIIRALDPAYAGFCDTVQAHASRFELDVLARFLEQGGPGATAMP